MDITLIALMGDNGVIGSEGCKPLFNAEHAKFVKDYVKGKYVLMGRKTFQALGGEIKGANNMVLSRTSTTYAMWVPTALCLDGAFIYTFDTHKADELVILGGASTFHAFYPWANRMHITHIRDNVQGDRYFPHFPGWTPGFINDRYEHGETKFERIDYRRSDYDPLPSMTMEDMATAMLLNGIRKHRKLKVRPLECNEE